MLDLRRERERRGMSLEQASGRSRIPVRYLMALENGTAAQVGPMRDWRQRYVTFLGLREAEAIPTEDRRGPEVAPAAEPEEEPSADPEHTSTTATIPRHEELPVGRLLMSGFVLTLLALLCLKLGALILDMSAENEVTQAVAEAAAPRDAPATAAALVSTEVAAPSTGPVAAVPVTEAPVTEVPVTEVKAALAKGFQQIRVRAVEPTRVQIKAGEVIKHRGLLEAGEAVDVESEETVILEIADLTQVVVHQNGARIEPLHNLSKGRRLVFLADGQD
jgi:cytoskeletal protein RodZ